MSIKVVIDSAGDVPPSVAKQYGITILPVYINIGDKGYLDGVELGSAGVLPKPVPLPRTPQDGRTLASGVYSHL